MKKYFIAVLIATAITIAGCNGTNHTVNEREKVENNLNPNKDNQTPVDPEVNHRVGFVNYKKDQLQDRPGRHDVITIDRNQMADMISKQILRTENFDQVATLVTDEEVLIAYKKAEDADPHRAATTAKQTAMSIMPRYFDVYVSDNPTLIADLHSLHNATTKNKNYDNTVDKIIAEMQKSPQGDDYIKHNR
ncbi:YhcN/YlaJ family sporulation lipoprotein [Virgibacillus sp. 179-BFC.A HS]|uniref:YhcN/YlaJ family sporulation lipoprotein n=1 Tax=Tigheibacillus jepli TaxID=3035914 RepID=A0ABU5CFZ0_9BACI|nr:YhcN/YlaJ family sporulation lipoprotein [Virgibacillus sp. 179-BFC.A HS]MDY0405231.1 YhcN/YlaJ family sporulation lipoprotein [Virgibacillus sp. 179-BFC.A HS]